MAATLTLGQIRIDRIVEHEVAFEHIRDFLPGITEEQLAENRRWMQPWAMDARDWLIITFQSLLSARRIRRSWWIPYR